MLDRDALANSYDRRRNNAVLEWTAYLSTFGAQYGTAISRYIATYDSQRRADEARLNTVVLVLSLVGGTALAATLGKEAIKGVFVERALRVARQRGWDRAVQQLSIGNGKATLEFVAGAVEKRILAGLSTATRAGLEAGFPQTGPSVVSTANLQKFLTDLGQMTSLAARGGRVAEEVVQADPRVISDEDAIRIFEGLERSHLMRSPRAANLQLIANEETVERIELALYLRDILGRDRYIESQLNNFQTHSDRFTVTSRSPVRESPSSSAWANRGATYRDGFTTHSNYIEIQDLGGKIKEKADSLFAKHVGGRPFGRGALTRADLIAAERGLSALAQRTRYEWFAPHVET